MSWQEDDAIIRELRSAQADLESLHRGLTLLTLDQRLYVLPAIEELEGKVRDLQKKLE